MRLLLSVLIILFPLSALADRLYVDKQADLEVLLTSAPCKSEKVLALIPKELHGKFSAANVKQAGKTYDACYGEPPRAPGVYFIIDETGTGGYLDKSETKPLTKT